MFQVQYLPGLIINYIAINKDLEKLPLQLYYLFYLQQYILTLATALPKLFTGAFSSNSGLDVCEV